MNSTTRNIARDTLDLIYPSLIEKRIKLFIVGKSINEQESIRKIIKNRLLEIKAYGFDVEVYYPEHIFTDLLYRGKKYNLLELENTLASSVESVLIIPESPGSFTELGSFTNHEKLKDKLIVLVDEQYKNANSFIMQGPVRYLDKHTDSIIIYYDLDNILSDEYSKQIIKNIHSAVRKIVGDKKTSLEDFISNPLEIKFFVLFFSSFVDMFPEPILIDAYKYLLDLHNIPDSQKVADENIPISLNILINDLYLKVQGYNYEITSQGYAFVSGLVKKTIQHSTSFDLIRSNYILDAY